MEAHWYFKGKIYWFQWQSSRSTEDAFDQAYMSTLFETHVAANLNFWVRNRERRLKMEKREQSDR